MNEEKTITTDNFKIEKNTISFNDSLLQISNISSVDVESVPKPKFHLWSIATCIIGLILIIEYVDTIRFLGVLLFFSALMYIIWYVARCIDGEDKYLCIYLNSGQVYYIDCANEKFLKKAIKVMKYCINNHGTQRIKIDFNQCTLENVPINIGNEKEVVNTITKGDNSNVQVDVVIKDWEFVQNELAKACESLPESSKEYAASKKALECALEEDEDGLIRVVNKYSDSFLSSIFKGVVSGVLVEIIKSMLI